MLAILELGRQKQGDYEDYEASMGGREGESREH